MDLLIIPIIFIFLSFWEKAYDNQEFSSKISEPPESRIMTVKSNSDIIYHLELSVIFHV